MSEGPPREGDDSQSATPDPLALAHALLKRGEIVAAEAIVAAALMRTPADADALHVRGVIAARRGDSASAIGDFRAAIASRARSPRTWLALGNILASTGDYVEAAAAYRRVMSYEPTAADAAFNLGQMQKRLGQRRQAVASFRAAWIADPLLFDAARQCVSTIADLVRDGERPALSESSSPPPDDVSVSVVLCSIDAAKLDRAVALYRRLFRALRHEIIAIRDARSLAEGYNWAVRHSSADIVVLSHDDVDVVADDFAARLLLRLRQFDAVGVVGSTRMEGPAIGWSGHPHLRGWITHRAAGDDAWRVDVLDPRPIAGNIALLDGVFVAARREVFRSVPYDGATFDGFHLADLDWSYRASAAGLKLGVAGDLLLVHESRGNYDATWQRYADRFSAKHEVGGSAAAASSFFGATLASAVEVRAFFGFLAGVSAGDS